MAVWVAGRGRAPFLLFLHLDILSEDIVPDSMAGTQALADTGPGGLSDLARSSWDREAVQMPLAPGSLDLPLGSSTSFPTKRPSHSLLTAPCVTFSTWLGVISLFWRRPGGAEVLSSVWGSEKAVRCSPGDSASIR